MIDADPMFIVLEAKTFTGPQPTCKALHHAGFTPEEETAREVIKILLQRIFHDYFNHTKRFPPPYQALGRIPAVYKKLDREKVVA